MHYEFTLFSISDVFQMQGEKKNDEVFQYTEVPQSSCITYPFMQMVY